MYFVKFMKQISKRKTQSVLRILGKERVARILFLRECLFKEENDEPLF